MYNIMVIMTDQQRKDSLGCYGNAKAKTPNLDKLAAKSVRFNRCYVANPICMPSRLSIFTGMYPRNHGMWTNGLLLPNPVTTIAGELAAAGYQTASFGKMHFTPYKGKGTHPESYDFWRERGDDLDWTGPYMGFEHVELTLGHTEPLAHYGRWFRENGGTEDMLKVKPVTGAPNSGVRSMPPELHDSSFIAERTIHYLRNQRDPQKPFFVVASFPDPHNPFDPPEALAKQYHDQDLPGPIGGPEDLATRPKHYREHYQGAWHRQGAIAPRHPNGLSEAHTRERIAHTYAMVELVDRNVGRILDALEQDGLMDNTIIVFVSDHGELLGDHGLWLKGPFFYESLVNVSFLLHVPGVAPRVSEHLVSTVDLVPTLCELVGLTVPEYVNGVSIAPHLRDPEQVVRDRCLIEYRNGYGRNDVSSKVLVTDTWKYVRYQTGECELTNLAEDPMERTNVAGDEAYRSVVQEMTAALLDEVLSTESKHPSQISHM